MGDDQSRVAEDLEVRTEKEVRAPHLYKVFLLNDDYTTMDFVVHVLETVFRKHPVEATQIMLHVHKSGSGLCGVYTRDIAETKVTAVHELSRKNGFPLQCTMERE